MAQAWFLCPYKRRDIGGRPGRYCAMDDFTNEIYGAGGVWSESEVVDNNAVVLVEAPQEVLDSLSLTFRSISRTRAAELIAGGRRKPRYDTQLDEIIMDGELVEAQTRPKVEAQLQREKLRTR